MSDGDTVFYARDVVKIYDMGEVQVQALRGVDMDLFPGELVVLLGPSGSATSGDIRYNGKSLVNANEKELTEYRRYHVGFVFQFYNF